MTTQQDRIQSLEVTVTRIDTRLDGMEARMATKEELQGVRTEIQAVRTEIQALRTDMERMKYVLLLAMITLTGIVVAAMALIVRFWS